MRPVELAHRSARALVAQSTFAATIAFHALVALPLARRELARWSYRAQTISDPALRRLALATLQQEHINSEGAAAFAVLYPPAARRLVPLLVAYQLAWDFVDTLLEHPTSAAGSPETVRRALEHALVLKQDGQAPEVASTASSDFLAELVAACRAGCVWLPTYGEARPALARLAARSDALLVTNAVGESRASALTAWASQQSAQGDELEPIELCAAGQCSLGVHALLATAASPSSRQHDFEAIEGAYFPWIDALCTLLDSLVDQDDDARTGDFSFIAQYSSTAHAEQRLLAITEGALRATRILPAGHRHRALMCAVVGMYLSTPPANTPQNRPITDAVLDVTAPLSRWACAVIGVQRRALR